MMNANSIWVSIILIVIGILTGPIQAQKSRKEQAKTIVVGEIKSIDSSGTKFDVLQKGEKLRRVYVNSESKVVFVGLPRNGAQKPMIGLGVKASCDNDGRVKTIIFTPPIGKPAMLGETRLSMTTPELFRTIDKDTSNSISYVEFSKYIYHSPKHGPDSFRKADNDCDGILNVAEFAEALSKVSWWRLSRMTPNEWFLHADKNRDDSIDIKEFAEICTSGNHIENIFKRTDKDKSGGLSQSETTVYIRSITHNE